ncbi:MAG TPA: ferritin-like domain-containing protein [Dehalococcoidia bacterium]|nr:ferritin-like domain-containing protein [Dehalococcoidia bacterium]
MALNSLADLYLYDLSEMLVAEKTIEQMLTTLAGKVQHEPLRQALEMHAQQTRQHIQNLQEVFQILNAQPKALTCYGLQGLRQGLDAIEEQKPSPNVRDMAILGAAEKVEHDEIAAYTTLLAQARLLREQQVIDLLHQNLRQEEEMARRIQSLTEQIGAAILGGNPAAYGYQPGTHTPQP